MAEGFWKKLKKPIMVAAPMSGVTDDAFRQMFLKYGKPSVFWTEFVSADGLFSKGEKYCLDVLKFNKRERPIVAQLFGGDPVNFEKAAEKIAKLGFDGIDINMGCPDTNIEKKGGGAALIKNPALAKEIILATKKGAGKLPVSVKTRIGYNKNEIYKWIPAILEENISALTVHFRTKKEAYTGQANWKLAEEIVKLRDEIAPETLIIGNGDIKTLEEAKNLVKETGLDGFMIGRAIVGNPWFFSDKESSLSDRLDVIIKHAEIFEKVNFRHFDSMKKHFHAYAKNFEGARELRENLMKVKNAKETKKVIQNFMVGYKYER
jgi:nifR3 family TIM-barrel protein